MEKEQGIFLNQNWNCFYHVWMERGKDQVWSRGRWFLRTFYDKSEEDMFVIRGYTQQVRCKTEEEKFWRELDEVIIMK